MHGEGDANQLEPLWQRAFIAFLLLSLTLRLVSYRPWADGVLGEYLRMVGFGAGFAAITWIVVRWQTWPGALRDGTVSAGDFDAATADYHGYVQWLSNEQLQGLATKARALDSAREAARRLTHRIRRHTEAGESDQADRLRDPLDRNQADVARLEQEITTATEEAAKYKAVRKQVAEELPELISRHQERMATLEQLHDLLMQLKSRA